MTQEQREPIPKEVSQNLLLSMFFSISVKVPDWSLSGGIVVVAHVIFWLGKASWNWECTGCHGMAATWKEFELDELIFLPKTKPKPFIYCVWSDLNLRYSFSSQNPGGDFKLFGVGFLPVSLSKCFFYGLRDFREACICSPKTFGSPPQRSGHSSVQSLKRVFRFLPASPPLT